MNMLKLKPKSLDLVKHSAKKALDLSKVNFKSQVVAVFDVSGSMDFQPNQFYKTGVMDAIATRVLALGLQLDDDGQIPVYTLGTGSKRLKDLTKDNLNSYVDDEVRPHVPQGTEYAPFINKIVDDAKEGDPMLVLVFTDGDNSDHADTKEAIKRASKLPIFFQWYGIHKGSNPGFPFLEKLDTLDGRDIDNCGYSSLGLDLNANMSDQESDTADENLYTDMLKEYKDFPTLAQSKNVTWANKSQLSRRRIFGIF